MNPIFLLSHLSETPDSGGDMLAGYIVITVILLGYLLSLALRMRSLKREKAMLDTVEEE